ncbi:Cytosolic iron-sulfur protein assembly protein [Collariella sp. IMI 366227]|nr:Cytosolic iron-sulfur protein assembly protein [Collariella sp. IMI 366227]
MGGQEDDEGEEEKEWDFNLVLEGHENEVKSLSFSPSGQYLATSSRDKSVWIWEDVGSGSGDGDDDEDEWETVAVLNEHDGDVKCVAWCPSHLPNAKTRGSGRHYSTDVLASASYDNTVRVWREDGDGEWVHTRDVYSVTWSAETGLVASTGSDGIIALYAEDESSGDATLSEAQSNWRVLGTVENAHGPYEVNHITWCKRFDPGTERKGKEEMLVTTGDDGVVRPWEVRIA